MSNKLKYFYLLILPALLFTSVFILKTARGPYYLNMEDPSYVYLINSLNVSLRFPVGHFDHPGTTVQIIGAVTLRFFHWFTNSSSDLIQDVLSRPEEYLNSINVVLTLIGSAVLFFLGAITFKLSRNILLSILIQLSPFVSLEIFYGYKIVASDNFLITVTLCFTGILIYYLFKVDPYKKPTLPFVFTFAVICGLALATKVSFFPLLIIPLLLIKGLKHKLLFLLLALVSFLIFVIPAISNYDKFAEWIWLLLLHSGSYGQGDASVVEVTGFFRSLRSIFTGDPIFTVSYFLSVITLAFVFFKSKRDGNLSEKYAKELKLLFTIILAVTIHILIVAKQYRQHYMIPAFILSLLSLSLCAVLLSSYFKKLKLRAVYIIIIIIIAAAYLYKSSNSYKYSLIMRDEAYKVNRYVKENSSNALVISSFYSASKEFSLAFGVSYSGRKIKMYKSILSEIQRENIFFIPWFDEFFSLISKDEVVKTLHENNKIIFQTNQNNADRFIQILESTYGIKTVSKTLVFSNRINETVYDITTKKIE